MSKVHISKAYYVQNNIKGIPWQKRAKMCSRHMAHHILPVTLASRTSHGNLAYRCIYMASHGHLACHSKFGTLASGTSHGHLAHHSIWHLAHQSCISGMSLSQPSSGGKTGVRGRYIALGKCNFMLFSLHVISCHIILLLRDSRKRLCPPQH